MAKEGTKWRRRTAEGREAIVETLILTPKSVRLCAISTARTFD